MEEKYFAAVNSSRGFISYYPELFGSAQRVFIIKGGPGTGKSYFMRRVGRYAEERGAAVRYIYCSSDPSSLDGIVIEDRIALLDGTSPHAVEATLPGARDELIDLGRFWNSERLAAKRETVSRLMNEKSTRYRCAYSALAAAGELDAAALSLALPCLDGKKLKLAAERYLRHIPNGKGFERSNLAVSSLGMGGAVRFSTLEDRADFAVSVSDELGLGHVFLEALVKEAEQKKLKIRVSHDPLCPHKADAVEICDTSTVFYISEADHGRRVNMKRFILPEATAKIRPEHRLLIACKTNALGAALTELAHAAEFHIALEEIYTSCMDFPAKDAFCTEFCRKIFK